MMNETTLRQTARKAIHSRRIPNRPPDRMWGGPGSGVECAICGQALSQTEVGFEVEFAERDPQVKQSYHLHVRCFAAWEFERDSENAAALLPESNGAGTIGSRERDRPYRGST